MRLRLFVLIAVPAVALLLLAALVITERHRSYEAAGLATTTAMLTGTVADVDEALGQESISSAQLFLGNDSEAAGRVDIAADRAEVDERLAELKQALQSDPQLNAGLSSSVAVIEETLAYRGDIDSGFITPLQIADRYGHIRSELIDALGRRAAATATTDNTLALEGLVELIEARSVHVDERLSVQLGILYEQWAVGQLSAAIQAMAIQDEKVGDRSTLALQSQELRVPVDLQEIREKLTTSEDVSNLNQDEWLQASDRWLFVLDASVERKSIRLLNLFESEERDAATARTLTALAVIGVLVLAVLITGQVSYRLVRRISTITTQAKRLALGERPERTAPTVGGRDEVAQLATTFDDMNDRLALAARTRELEYAVLKSIAHGDDLEDTLGRSARLLDTIDVTTNSDITTNGASPNPADTAYEENFGDAGTPTYRFTSIDPGSGADPISEPVPGETPLWLVDQDGHTLPAPTDSQGLVALRLAALAQSRADTNEQLARQARRDGLTGLLNRRAILEYSDDFERPAPSESMTGFVFVDLDDFKRVNDQLGHAVGDAVLIGQSRRLQALSAKHGGQAGRLGGDEFLAVLPNLSSEKDLANIAKAFVASLAKPLAVRGAPVTCTASAGAVVAREGVSAEELLHEADTALYEAKNNGRGAVVVASEALWERVHQADELRIAVRTALQEGQIVPFFQPIWDQNGTRVCGLEALARWRRPSHGVVGPNVFLPVAEELGMLRAVDEALFRRVCEQVVAWRGNGFDVPPVHVNASSVRIEDPSMVADTLAVLEASKCPPSQIIVEVTESGLMADLASSSNSLQVLRDYGIRIAADDFGSGYSSLSYLQRLPVDVLKIDRQFVDHIDQSPPNQSIVSAVQTMATALGMATIAEGVERKEELDYLTSIGCKQIQGFLLGRPSPPQETERLLVRSERWPAQPATGHQPTGHKSTSHEMAALKSHDAGTI